jgi:amino acid transporter
VLIILLPTGMVSYKGLGVGDPLSFVFVKVGLPRLSGLAAVSAVFAMASVLLVFQLGQPRTWLTMSRNVLPPVFSKLHPRFHTPSFSTLITGVFVGVPALFLNNVRPSSARPDNKIHIISDIYTLNLPSIESSKVCPIAAPMAVLTKATALPCLLSQ